MSYKQLYQLVRLKAACALKSVSNGIKHLRAGILTNLSGQMSAAIEMTALQRVVGGWPFQAKTGLL